MKLQPGVTPQADVEVEGEVRHVSARLVIGADGRESQLATLLEFERTKDPPELFTGGLQLSGDLEIEHALYFFLHAITGRGSIFVKNKPGNFRVYLLHHKDALPRRLSGERDFLMAMEHFYQIGIPASWLESLTPHGIFASFDGAHRWITHPARGNCVLIADVGHCRWRRPLWTKADFENWRIKHNTRFPSSTLGFRFPELMTTVTNPISHNERSEMY